MTEPLKLTLVLKEVPAQLTTADGEVQDYVIKELDGKGRDKFLNSMKDRVRFNGKGEPSGLKNFDGLQSSLLCRCLYGPDGELVEEKTIQAFPSTALNAMFKAAQKLSALEEVSEEDEKNPEG